MVTEDYETIEGAAAQLEALRAKGKLPVMMWWNDGEVTHVVVRDWAASRSPHAFRTLCGLQAEDAPLGQIAFRLGRATCLGCIAEEGAGSP